MIERSKGSLFKPWFNNEVSTRLINRGTPAKIVFVKYVKPLRISSCGVGGERRISSVLHAE
jgi:hypothetical protein